MPNPVLFKFRYALLTYSQCDGLDPFDILIRLSELRLECLIGREAHQDGGIHYHAFVDAGERTFRSRVVGVFDVAGHHPNVQHVGRTPWLAYDYVCKEGDVVYGGATRPRQEGDGVVRTSVNWAQIMGAETREEFFQLLLDLAPRDLGTSFTSLSKYADWRYRDDPAPYVHPSNIEFNLERVEGIYSWARENLGRSVHGGKAMVPPPLPSLRSGGLRPSLRGEPKGG